LKKVFAAEENLSSEFSTTQPPFQPIPGRYHDKDPVYPNLFYQTLFTGPKLICF
jgi:hypothetical protein